MNKHKQLDKSEFGFLQQQEDQKGQDRAVGVLLPFPQKEQEEHKSHQISGAVPGQEIRHGWGQHPHGELATTILPCTILSVLAGRGPGYLFPRRTGRLSPGIGGRGLLLLSPMIR